MSERHLVTKEPDEIGGPPVLFVHGPGHGAWAFAEDWLTRTAARGFPAHALTLRADGDLRTHVHDVVQTAAGLPKQTVLVGHGGGAWIVAHALGRYPARAAVLAAPVLDGRAVLGAALKANPLGALPAIFGGRLRLGRRQLFGPDMPVAEADAYTGRSARRAVTTRPAPPRPVGNPPVLVLGSPDDRVVPRAALDRAAVRYGGAPLLFPGMGHDLMLDVQREEPIEAVLDWLGKKLG